MASSEELPWVTLASEYLFKSPWRNFRRDTVDIGQGRMIDYTYVETHDAVYVVPVTAKAEIVLIRQYRYPVRDWVVQLPAGTTDATDPAELQAEAMRELREEVGGMADAANITFLVDFYQAVADSSMHGWVYLANGVTLSTDGPEGTEPEEMEVLHTLLVPARQAFAMARAGQIKEVGSAMALLVAEPQILALLEAQDDDRK